jgi:peptide-methionine (S)-S-oxide reductase
VITLLLFACGVGEAASDRDPAPIPAAKTGQEVAVFAGGCFWCMESDFDKMPGVVATTSGYAGGTLANPSYEDVNTETTGHRESVRVIYDASKIDYAGVLDWYWHHVDPTDDGGQFCDRGESYRTAIFAQDDAQYQAAMASRAAIDASHVLAKPIVTPVVKDAAFYAAEGYHQDFHEKDPGRYQPYRLGCGRDARVAELWGTK